MTGFDIFVIALGLLVIFTLLAGIKTVPQGYNWTVERFGKFTRILSPGLNLIVPYFDRRAGRQPDQNRAGGWCKADGGGSLVTPI